MGGEHICVIGAGGYVGKKVVSALFAKGAVVVQPFKKSIWEDSGLDWLCREVSCVVNCAGFVGRPNVDACEAPEVYSDVLESNVVLVEKLREICEGMELPLIHISSGCIYSEYCKWTEEDMPNFAMSHYATSKILGERTLDGMERCWVLRPRMPYCEQKTNRNLLWKMKDYGQIVDAQNSITPLNRFAERVAKLATGFPAPYGIYNMTHSVPIGNLDIAEMMCDVGLRPDSGSKISVDDFNKDALAKRSFTTLDCEKAEKAGIGLGGDTFSEVRKHLSKLAI